MPRPDGPLPPLNGNRKADETDDMDFQTGAARGVPTIHPQYRCQICEQGFFITHLCIIEVTHPNGWVPPMSNGGRGRTYYKNLMIETGENGFGPGAEHQHPTRAASNREPVGCFPQRGSCFLSI